MQATFTSQKCDGYTLFSQDKIYKKINKTLGEDGLEGVLENIDGNEAAELAWMQWVVYLIIIATINMYATIFEVEPLMLSNSKEII